MISVLGGPRLENKIHSYKYKTYFLKNGVLIDLKDSALGFNMPLRAGCMFMIDLGESKISKLHETTHRYSGTRIVTM